MSQNDPYADRKKLTFEQAEGVEPLPRQLLLKEMSSELRALLWEVVYFSITIELFDDFLGQRWGNILRDHHVNHAHLAVVEFDHSGSNHIINLKTIFFSGHYLLIFGFLQFVLRHKNVPRDFSKEIDCALVRGRAAYRVLEARTIIPVGSEAELATLERAFVDLTASEFRGARSHLHAAGSELTAGNFTSSVRESIHAVESCCPNP